MTDPLFSVDGQVVLVSGGSRGIGLAIARAFAERAANVIVTGTNRDHVDSAVDAMKSCGSVTGRVCDVRQQDAIDSTVSELFDRFGKIDTLVNVAGVNRRKPAINVSHEDYDLILDTNLKGAFQLSVAVGRRMLEQGNGSQINITSLNNDRPLLNVAPYAMSKAGMGQMTKALALEWSGQGVRVNGIAPGFILTDLTRKLWSDETMQQWGVENTPQRRLGVPEDLAGTAIFLASPASAFMTGQILFVDGGFSAGWRWPIPEDNQ